MTVRSLAVSLAGALLVVASAAADSADEITAASAAFNSTFNEGDSTALSDLFSTDAIALAPGWGVVTGNDNITDMYGAFFKAGFHGLETEQASLDFVDDTTALEVVTEISHRNDGNGGVEIHHFKALRVWRKDADDSWRLYRISFNPSPES